jgi:hypothetical protein
MVVRLPAAPPRAVLRARQAAARQCRRQRALKGGRAVGAARNAVAQRATRLASEPLGQRRLRQVVPSLGEDIEREAWGPSEDGS